MSRIYKARIKRLCALLKESYPECLCAVSSNPQVPRSRDGHYPYRPNSDLFYLTGLTNEDLTLVLRPSARLTEQVILFAKRITKQKKLWEGEQEKLAPRVRDLGVTLQTVDDCEETLRSLSAPVEIFIFQSHFGTTSFNVANRLIALNSSSNPGTPHTFVNLDQVMEPLRLIKDLFEVKEIESAAKVTADALISVLPHIRAGTTEAHIAREIERAYLAQGCIPSFRSIVGSGESAATLHYHYMTKKLLDNELVLIDCGAEKNLYAADITRTFPVNGKFNGILKDLYIVVLNAQKKALATVRPGLAIRDVYDAASLEITRGLVDLGVLKGNSDKLRKDGLYKPYFPHGIGHSLGLDVHDVGRLRSGKGPKLAENMVLTIEPGIYFSKPIGKIPACGIRIEDDVLITSKGVRNLTSGLIPTDPHEIELMMRRK